MPKQGLFDKFIDNLYRLVSNQKRVFKECLIGFFATNNKSSMDKEIK